MPSDSPDDWRALEDLRSLNLAAKYGLDLATQIEPFQVWKFFHLLNICVRRIRPPSMAGAWPPRLRLSRHGFVCFWMFVQLHLALNSCAPSAEAASLGAAGACASDIHASVGTS